MLSNNFAYMLQRIRSLLPYWHRRRSSVVEPVATSLYYVSVSLVCLFLFICLHAVGASTVTLPPWIPVAPRWASLVLFWGQGQSRTNSDMEDRLCGLLRFNTGVGGSPSCEVGLSCFLILPSFLSVDLSVCLPISFSYLLIYLPVPWQQSVYTSIFCLYICL